MVIKKNKKNELRKLTHNKNLRHETYNFINKQFEREFNQKYYRKTI
jgi:hypothetical protein